MTGRIKSDLAPDPAVDPELIPPVRVVVVVPGRGEVREVLRGGPLLGVS
jgi:hypothetical protein